MANLSTVPLEAYQQITNKKAQYGRYIDTKQWENFSLITLPNALFRFQNVDGTTISRNGDNLSFGSLEFFVGHFSKFFANAQTLHMFGPPQMTMDAEDRVRVIWAMEDQLCFQGHSTLAELRGGGYYHETWVCKEGIWWLSDLTLRRTYTKVSGSGSDEIRS